MKKIYLSGKYNHLFALVDDEDYEELIKSSWHNNHGYARKQEKGLFTFMHQAIMNPKVGELVDHINHDRLDNRRENLRIVTRAQNSANSRTFRKYKGVYLTRSKKFESRIRFNNKVIYIGTFVDEKEAAKAYNRKAFEMFGEFAYLNKIEGE